MSEWVYIAAPYTHPDPVANTNVAAQAFFTLRDAGFVPFCPHTSLLLHLITPRPVEFWYAYDLRILERCDVMLRLPGESTGADAEAEHAFRKHIRVFEGTAAQFIAFHRREKT